jgi:hypothetical protein
MNKLRKSMAGLPGSPTRAGNNLKSDKLPIIPPDTFELLMKILQPIPVNHQSCHADMIKNVVIDDIRRTIETIYNKNSY